MLNQKPKSKRLIIILTALIICAAALLIFYVHDTSQIGKELDSYKCVPVYYNGVIFTQSHGQNYGDDGYYFGYKWQCVEYVKRFYKLAKGHAMPDTHGNAKDFFGTSVGQGELNASRGLYQYKNGGGAAPQPDDLIVFNDTKYGHVAIVTAVTDSYVEIIQQNVRGKTRAQLPLRVDNGNYYVGDKRQPAGWLRL